MDIVDKKKSVEIFCCYAQVDHPLLLKLRTHLAFLERAGTLNIWHDQDISPGTEWEEEINKRLNTAHIILLFISPDFMSSKYCYSKEMMRAMERHESGEARVIPILLRPSIWQEAPFAKLQMLPNNTQAVTEWRNREKALSVIAQRIKQVVKEQFTKLSEPASESSPSTINSTRFRPTSTDGIVRRRDWGEAPDVPVFFGRTKELVSLEQWITEDRCRLVALVGLRGIGKTDLSIRLAQGIQEQFDYVIWRRLLNAPKMSEILTDLIKFLSNQQEVTLPDSASEQISRLLYYLRESRCLVILDNVEMILQAGKHAGQYSPGYEDYGQLFEQIAEIPHQSCLLLTSREKTPEVARRESKTGPVRSLEVRGLNVADSKKIFAEIGSFSGSAEDWKQLNYLYNGNPLALELAARHIKEVFFESISSFLREGKPFFADLQSLLDWHFNRLSDSHKEVMYWFAINRKPVSLSELKEDILLFRGKEQISSTLHSLQRLIPLEKSAHSFTLQPVLIEYMTQCFVEQVVIEVRNGEINLFNTHALLKTSISDYVRDIQSRLILRSMTEKLLEIYGNRIRLEIRLKEILSLLREHFRSTSGYAGGNVLNLLCYLKVDLRGYNFSSLAVWQAYLQGVSVQEVNFAYADLARSVFTDTFGSILSVALSPQGDILAAGTGTGEIRVWHATSGLPLRTFRGHIDWISSVTFSPDGKTLASGSDDQTVCLWEVNSGQCLYILQGHTSGIRSVAFSPDGRTLASGSYDQTVRLWKVSNGQCFTTLQGHASAIRSVAFSPDGSTLATGSEDRAVRLWEVSNGQCFTTLQGHASRVRSVAFSPDGSTLASGSDDHTVRLWEVSSGQCLNTLQGHTNAVSSVNFSLNSKILVSGSYDQTIRLWEVSSGQCLNTLQGHTSPVWSVAFNSDGKTLASGSDDRAVRIWEISSGQCLKTFYGHTNAVWSVAFSPDGKTLASGSDDQAVRIWEISSGQCLKTLYGHTNAVWSVAFSPDGKTLASGSEDRTVHLWKVSNGQYPATLHGHSHWVSSVAFSPDGKTLASSSGDRAVHLWEISSGKLLATLSHTSAVRSVAFSPDGKTLASGSEDRVVRMWEIRSGRCLNTLQGHTNAVHSVAFSPDSSTVASGSYDQTVCLWEASSGQCLKIFYGHTSAVRSVAFSSDGKTLASGSNDHTVRLWEVSSGQCFNTFRGHSHWVRSVAFSPDNKTLASGSYDGVINLWDRQIGTCLCTLRSDRPYERMNITQVKGLTEAQKVTLRLLGAIEDDKQELF